MNSSVIVLGLLTLAFAGAAAFAFLKLAKVGAALALAEERLRLGDSNAELLKLHALQSAEAVAEKLVARAADTFKSQEDQAKVRLEAQLKPVAESLAKFEGQGTAMEKARASAAAAGLRVDKPDSISS